MKKTRERLILEDKEKSSPLFYRHLAAYRFCSCFTRGKTVLDLGCGDGYGSYLLSGKAKKVIGIDSDKKTIKLANQRYKSKNLGFIVGDVLKIPKLTKFDIIIALQLIEHIADTESFLKQIKDILIKDGKVIISTPNKGLRLKKGEKPWNLFHVHEYSFSELYNLLSNHFSQVAILGLKAMPSIYKLEKKRLFIRCIIAKLDVFKIYHHIPKELTDWFLEKLKKLLFKNKRRGLEEISLDDFWVTKERVGGALDLIVICKK